MMTAEHYTVAMDLLDDGIDRCAAQLVKYNKGSAYKALLTPTEYADLALRLGQALAREDVAPDRFRGALLPVVGRAGVPTEGGPASDEHGAHTPARYEPSSETPTAKDAT